MDAKRHLRFLKNKLLYDARGVTTVEYAVMIVLIALAVAAFGAGLNNSVTGVFSRTINLLNGTS